MGAVWTRFVAELHERWRAWLGLGSLVGLAAGAVIASAAGGFRTDTAYDRFLAHQAAVDMLVACQSPEDFEGDVPVKGCDPAELARLPQVDDAADVIAFGPDSVEVRTKDGRPVQPDPEDFGYTGPGEITLVASPDGRFGTDLNRLKVLEGRRPDPDRADEVAVPLELADRLQLGVGDELRATFLVPTDGEDEAEPARLPVALRIVAIEAAPFEIKPASGHYQSNLHLTPALLSRLERHAPLPEPILALRLASGVQIDEFEAELARRGADIATQTDQARLVERSIRPQAVALWVLAAMTALVALAVLGQALARQTFVDSADHPVLRALGLRRIQLFGLGILRAAAIGAVGAGVAMSTGYVLSPLTPTGLARTVEPDPGLSLNGAALVFGGTATLLLVMLVAAWPAWRLARVVGTGLDPKQGVETRRRSLVATAAVRAALPPAVTTGVRMALEPDHRRTAPVRSTLIGVTLGVVAMFAALTFGASLEHLLTTPRLQGFNWDRAVRYPYAFDEATGEPRPVDEDLVRALLAKQSGIDEFAPGTIFRPFPSQEHALELGSERVPADLLTFGHGQGSIGPTVIRGRAPTAPHEILVGTEILDKLGADIGDTIESVGRVGDFERPDELEVVSTPLEIVGVGVVPTPAGQLGRGAAMTLDGVRAINPDAVPDVVWLRFAADADPDRVLAALGDSAGAGQSPSLVELEGSEEVLNVAKVEDLPLVLAALAGVLAGGVLGHALFSGVRARRRDLAVLRALGFGRRRVGATVAWQATTIVAVALAAGLPLGIGLGRWIWRLFAEELGVHPQPANPWPLSLTVLAALVVANLIAAAPAWVAARTRPGVALRAA